MYKIYKHTQGNSYYIKNDKDLWFVHKGNDDLLFCRGNIKTCILDAITDIANKCTSFRKINCTEELDNIALICEISNLDYREVIEKYPELTI